MAAMSAPQRPYDYGPGPFWGMSSHSPARSPSSSSRNAYPLFKHPYAADTSDYEDEDAYDVDSAPPPDVRITAPSRAEEERRPNSVVSDDRSVYSERMSTTQNFYSSVFQSGTSPSSHHLSALSTRTDLSRDSWQREGSARPDSNVDPFSFMKYESPRQPLPKVVVSSPSENSFRTPARFIDDDAVSDAEGDPIIPQPITPPPFQPPQGRVPSAVQGKRNFSRPNRPTVTPSSMDASSMASQSPSRPYVVGSEEQKREVLERNRSRLGQGSPTSQPASPSDSSVSQQSSLSSPSWGRPENGFNGNNNEYMAVPQPRSRSPSPSRSSPQLLPELTQSESSSSTSSHPSPRTPRTPQGQGLVVLPSSPPGMRHSTTESVYSTYSYYQLDSNSAAPSPSTQTHFDESKLPQAIQNSPMPMNYSPSPQPTSITSPTRRVKSPASSPNPNEALPNPTTADDYLALGIAHHEADRLTESAECFEKSATLNGGCAVGMLMWGLSLRHGWGVQKDEVKAFKWLKQAAEHAVVDLQQGRSNVRRDAVKKELVLAVYEVGQCFFQGWGVPRDKQMGVSYFQTAAQLGDPDAQQDLAFCLANGKGCKKDRKAAAKWYRAAAAQGASTVGLAWIYKPKYAD